MHAFQQLSTSAAFWIMNPFNMMLLLVACHEMRVIKQTVGERHLLGYSERGLDLMSWYATSFCAAIAVWLNRYNPPVLQVAGCLGIVVLLRGVILMRRYRLDQWTVTHSGVYLAERSIYAAVVLIAGSLCLAL